MKRTLSVTGMLCLGVVAALGIWLACFVVMILLGAAFYSVTLGALVAPVVALGIFVYRWSRRRATTAWPMMGTMVVTQVVIAVSAFLDSPSTATTFFH